MLDLNPIKVRYEAATPGPWLGLAYEDGKQALVLVDAGIGPHIATLNDGIEHTLCDNGPANAAFIGNARQDVPTLVAEVERLRRIITDAHNEVVDGESAYDAIERAVERM